MKEQLDPAMDSTRHVSPFGKPVSYAFRFSNKVQYQKAVDMYYERLRLPDPPGPGEPLNDSYSIPIGRKLDIELLLVWKDKSRSRKKDQAIIYYKVQGYSNIDDAYKAVLASSDDFKTVDPPYADKTFFRETERCLFEDQHGNELGLIINPPWPRFAFASKRKGDKKRKGSKLLWLLAGVAAGFVLTPLLSGSKRP
jgi:hypothetical protein